MKVRWSSTLVMLTRCVKLRKVGFFLCLWGFLLIHGLFQYVERFIYELGAEETNWEKRRLIDEMKLTDDEWNHVEVLIELLKVRFLVIHCPECA
jgi:hypothetical protein